MYITIDNEFEYQENIKSSLFIACLKRVCSYKEAMDFLEEIKNRHQSAAHYCWAYKIDQLYRFNDDREPNQTAGKPIFMALNDLNMVMAVVVRYFGGIKLGKGGLVRAYGGVTSQAVNLANKITIKETIKVEIRVDFSLQSNIFYLLKKYNLMQEIEYTEEGIYLTINIDKEKLESFKSDLFSLSRNIKLQEI